MWIKDHMKTNFSYSPYGENRLDSSNFIFERTNLFSGDLWFGLNNFNSKISYNYLHGKWNVHSWYFIIPLNVFYENSFLMIHYYKDKNLFFDRSVTKENETYCRRYRLSGFEPRKEKDGLNTTLTLTLGLSWNYLVPDSNFNMCSIKLPRITI